MLVVDNTSNDRGGGAYIDFDVCASPPLLTAVNFG